MKIWAIMSFTFVYYSSEIINFRKIVVIGVIFFAFLWIIQSIRLSQYVQGFIYVTSKMKYSSKYQAFTEPYMYITMNLENMARGVDLMQKHSFGLLTGDWIIALAGIKKWALNYFNINPRPFLVSGYNTFPFLWEYFYDFGIVGVFIFPLLSGFFIAKIYYLMRSDIKVKWIVYYSQCMAIILLSFFTNPLTMLNFIFSIFVLWIIHRFLFVEDDKLSISSIL